jgi:hypothetical protein
MVPLVGDRSNITYGVALVSFAISNVGPDQVMFKGIFGESCNKYPVEVIIFDPSQSSTVEMCTVDPSCIQVCNSKLN